MHLQACARACPLEPVNGQVSFRPPCAARKGSYREASRLARFNHATVPAGALWAISVLIGAAGLLLAALAHYRCSALLGVVVCATTGLIISPVTWTHHMVWILPAIAWPTAAPERPRWRRAMAAVTAVLFWAAPIWWVPNGNLSPLHEIPGSSSPGTRSSPG